MIKSIVNKSECNWNQKPMAEVMVSVDHLCPPPHHFLLVRFGEMGGTGVKENKMRREGRNFIFSLGLKKVLL